MISSIVKGNLKRSGFKNVLAYDRKGAVICLVDSGRLHLKLGKADYISIPLPLQSKYTVAVSGCDLIAVVVQRGICLFDMDLKLVVENYNDELLDIDRYNGAEVEWVNDVLVVVPDRFSDAMLAYIVDGHKLRHVAHYHHPVSNDGFGSDIKYHEGTDLLFVGAAYTDVRSGMTGKVTAGGRVYIFSFIDDRFIKHSVHIESEKPTEHGLFGRDIRLCPEGILIEGYSNGYSKTKGRLRTAARYEVTKDEDGGPVARVLKSFSE